MKKRGPEYKSELEVESEVQESMVTSSDIAIGLLKHGAKTSWAWTKFFWSQLQDPNTRMTGPTVSLVSLPVSICVAVACGCDPVYGLIGATVGGGIAAVFGGSEVR
jgi:hypothetical protein